MCRFSPIAVGGGGGLREEGRDPSAWSVNPVGGSDGHPRRPNTGSHLAFARQRLRPPGDHVPTTCVSAVGQRRPTDFIREGWRTSLRRLREAEGRVRFTNHSKNKLKITSKIFSPPLIGKNWQMLQMNQLNLSNNRLKLKTTGKLSIIFGNLYDVSQFNEETRKNSTCNRLDLGTL